MPKKIIVTERQFRLLSSVISESLVNGGDETPLSKDEVGQVGSVTNQDHEEKTVRNPTTDKIAKINASNRNIYTDPYRTRATTRLA